MTTFDAFITNADRTVRNTNLLVWHKRLWLIDNGAAFYFHYGGPDYVARASGRFPEIRSHVLLRRASALREADRDLSARLTTEVIEAIVHLIPDDWLDDGQFHAPSDQQQAYRKYLLARLAQPRAFVEEVISARAQLI